MNRVAAWQFATALAVGSTTGGVAAASPAAGPMPADAGPAMSADARDTVRWAVDGANAQGLPFVVIDKRAARVFAFDARGALRGSAAALLGLARGDDGVPGIGQRRLATITPAERTTPAGRFQAALGHDFEQDILWIDYDAALSLHRVVAGRPVERRAARLASPAVDDNRISYGCVNVPPRFYDDVVKPLFAGTVGIVYILPETRPLRSVFAVPPTPVPTQ